MKHRQDFAGSRSSEENLNKFITHTHTHTHISGNKINYKHLHTHFMQFRTKKDGEIGKQLDQQMHLLNWAVSSTFLFFPTRKVHDK